jgi:hypothetical protein
VPDTLIVYLVSLLKFLSRLEYTVYKTSYVQRWKTWYIQRWKTLFWRLLVKKHLNGLTTFSRNWPILKTGLF